MHAGLTGGAVAQIGLRGFVGANERESQRRDGFTVVGMRALRELGPAGAVELAVSSVLQHCDVIYLTVDIDGVDPSAAPGTGTQVPGGILGHEFLDLLRHLGTREEIVAMDLVEVAPPLDPTNQTTMLAAHGLFGFIEQRFMRTVRP